MRRLWLVLLIVIGAGAAYVAAHGALIEVGREVIVLRTQDDGGAWRTTRLWIVDHDGSPWLHGGSSGWMQDLRARPIVEVERAGETHQTWAVTDLVATILESGDGIEVAGAQA